MEILFAAGHLPASQGRQAGAKTSYFMCDYLAKQHRVHLLAFATEDELADFDQQDMKIFSSWEVMPVTNRVRIQGVLSAPELPLAIAARHSGAYERQIRAICEQHPVNVAIFDHTAIFQYAFAVAKHVVTVGNAHDVYTQSSQRKATRSANALSRSLLTLEARRMESWEKKACAGLDLVVVPSQKDKEILDFLEPRANVMVIDPWMSALPATPDARREPGTLVFWGAMNRSENTDAARWAAEALLPAIRKTVPEATLYIAGNHGEDLAGEFQGRPDLVLTGFVRDLASLMSRMEIALLPLRLGAGIKVKTLECMSAALPVVTTPVGAEGIGGTHGVHYLVADTAGGLIEHTVHLLQHPEEARKMGESAREFVSQRHDFAARLKCVEDRLEECLQSASR